MLFVLLGIAMHVICTYVQYCKPPSNQPMLHLQRLWTKAKSNITHILAWINLQFHYTNALVQQMANGSFSRLPMQQPHACS